MSEPRAGGSGDVQLGLAVDASVAGALDRAARKRLRRRLQRMLRAVSLSDHAPLELAVRLTDDAAMRQLNRSFRQRDRATDVLAFAARESPGWELCPHVLGDIVISVETASRQARGDLFAEIVFLSAHGLCHLIGYDHQTDHEEAEMNARMGALLAEAARRGAVRPA